MRIQIASDLHLEYISGRFPNFLGVEPCQADVLVLAGDIASGTRVLDLFSDWPYPVVYVPGNHEFYGSRIMDVLMEFRERSADYPNIHVLSPGNLESVELGGVRFLGCTLWTDYDVFGRDQREQAMQECERKIVDHREIRSDSGALLRAETLRNRHHFERKWLADMLARPFAGPTITVTHHAPHPNSIHARFADDMSSAAYVSDLSSYLGLSSLHIHGHTHDSFDYLIKGTRVVSNPMGYCRGIRRVSTPQELARENPAFKAQLVIEIQKPAKKE